MAVREGVKIYICDICLAERTDNRFGNQSITIEQDHDVNKHEDVCIDCIRAFQVWRDGRRVRTDVRQERNTGGGR